MLNKTFFIKIWMITDERHIPESRNRVIQDSKIVTASTKNMVMYSLQKQNKMCHKTNMAEECIKVVETRKGRGSLGGL